MLPKIELYISGATFERIAIKEMLLLQRRYHSYFDKSSGDSPLTPILNTLCWLMIHEVSKWAARLCEPRYKGPAIGFAPYPLSFGKHFFDSSIKIAFGIEVVIATLSSWLVGEGIRKADFW